MTFLDEGGATRLPELRREIAGVFLRRTKKEVLDLPDKIVSVQVCELSPEAWREYHQAWEKYLEWVSNHPSVDEEKIENILSAQHLIELGKLKQVCSLAKLENITADVKNAVDQEQKVIIFSQYTETIKQLANQIGLEVKCVTLTGQDDSESRQKSVDDFMNDPNTKVFIGNIKAAGVGLNLTSASIIIFADMDWSPAIHQQAEDRAHRIGQEGTVNVYYYVAKDTIEEDIVEILGQKREIIQQIMDGKKTYTSSVETDLVKRLSARLGKTH